MTTSFFHEGNRASQQLCFQVEVKIHDHTGNPVESNQSDYDFKTLVSDFVCRLHQALSQSFVSVPSEAKTVFNVSCNENVSMFYQILVAL